jgi:hypothetical protein
MRQPDCHYAGVRGKPEDLNVTAIERPSEEDFHLSVSHSKVTGASGSRLGADVSAVVISRPTTTRKCGESLSQALPLDRRPVAASRRRQAYMSRYGPAMRMQPTSRHCGG